MKSEWPFQQVYPAKWNFSMGKYEQEWFNSFSRCLYKVASSAKRNDN